MEQYLQRSMTCHEERVPHPRTLLSSTACSDLPPAAFLLLYMIERRRRRKRALRAALPSRGWRGGLAHTILRGDDVLLHWEGRDALLPAFLGYYDKSDDTNGRPPVMTYQCALCGAGD